MRTLQSKAALREALAPRRERGGTIGLVPTMGYLHAGHAALFEASAARCHTTVASVFVNPKQFGPGEDLDRYPRDPDRDAELAAAHGVDLLYLPQVEEVYPPGFATAVEVEGLTEVLCGAPASRGREHFRGVTTVVAKLLSTVRPDAAFLGRKDAQQAIVIERMARDLDFDCEIVTVPTVREPDGLALSSRNAYLGERDRERARALHATLRELERELAAGGQLGPAIEAARKRLRAAGVELEYLEARDASSLAEVSTLNGRPVLVALAAEVGGTRLIDNIVINA